MRNVARLPLLFALAAFAAGACASPPQTPVAIPNARLPADGLLTGGQPSPEQIESASRAGFRTVINLRADAEQGFAWEREAVEHSGMRYVQIPIAGPEGLNRENVERIDNALRQARAEGPVLLHCASGNRAGAVLALREAWFAGAEPEAALKLGKEAGLTQLEPQVRRALGLGEVESPK